MSTKATKSDPRSPSAAERMRLHRKRRRRGLRHVSILIHTAEIEALIGKGFLQADERESTEALQIAVQSLLTELMFDSA
jgi:hypothetical protein